MTISPSVWNFRGCVLSPIFFAIFVLIKLNLLRCFANDLSLVWWRFKCVFKIDVFEDILSWKILGIVIFVHPFMGFV